MSNIDFYIQIIKSYGYIAVALSVFVESMGFPFPGEFLIVSGGIAASLGVLDLELVIIFTVIFAFLGYNTGYVLGRLFGDKVLNKIKRFKMFHPDRINKMKSFYFKWGYKAIFIGRFLPVFRTYMSLLSGIFKAPYHVFAVYNFLGTAAWVSTFTFLGYLLGENIELLNTVMYSFKGIIIAIAALITIFLVYSFFIKKDNISD